MISPAGWGEAPRWQGPSTLGISRLHDWLLRAPTLCQPLLLHSPPGSVPSSSLFYSREPESLLFKLGLSLCKFTSVIQVSPTSVTKQEQPSFLRKSIGLGLLGVPSGFTSISSKPGLTSPSATSSACWVCVCPCGDKGSSAALLGSCPQGCAHKQAPSTRPKPHRALLPLPTCSSLVQTGKNQAASALPQRTSQ